MGWLLQRLGYLLKAEKNHNQKAYQEWLKSLRDLIATVSNEARKNKARASGDSFEKYFDEYIEAIQNVLRKRPREKSNFSHNQNPFDDDETDYYRQAEQEYSQYQDSASVFPNKILKYYQALELPAGADSEQVRKAWKQMMRKYHPDLFNNDPNKRRIAAELSARITQAYQELSDYLKTR